MSEYRRQVEGEGRKHEHASQKAGDAKPRGEGRDCHPDEAHHPDGVDDGSTRACPSAGLRFGVAHASAATSFYDARGVKVRDAEGETEQAKKCEDLEHG